MKWVKASERLPEVPKNASGLVIIREVANHNNYKTCWYGNLPNGRGSGSLLKRYPNRYEWLEQDESLDAATPVAEVYRKALEKIAKKMKVSEHDGTAMFYELVKECKERVLIAREALSHSSQPEEAKVKYLAVSPTGKKLVGGWYNDAEGNPFQLIPSDHPGLDRMGAEQI